MTATLAVDLRGENVTSRPNEPSQFHRVLSLPRPDVRNATALAKPQDTCKLRRLLSSAGGAKARSGEPTAKGGRNHQDEADNLP